MFALQLKICLDLDYCLDKCVCVAHISNMGFEWDIEKEQINIAKHGIDFVQASQIFKFPVLERVDTRNNYGEERIIVLGQYDSVVLCVVFTLRHDNRRIISAWRASRNDRQEYQRACRQL